MYKEYKEVFKRIISDELERNKHSLIQDEELLAEKIIKKTTEILSNTTFQDLNVNYKITSTHSSMYFFNTKAIISIDGLDFLIQAKQNYDKDINCSPERYILSKTIFDVSFKEKSSYKFSFEYHNVEVFVFENGVTINKNDETFKNIEEAIIYIDKIK